MVTARGPTPKEIARVRHRVEEFYTYKRSGYLKGVDVAAEGIRGIVRESVRCDLVFAASPYYSTSISAGFYPPALKEAVREEQRRLRAYIAGREMAYYGVPEILKPNVKEPWGFIGNAATTLEILGGGPLAYFNGAIFMESVQQGDAGRTLVFGGLAVMFAGLALEGLARALETHRVKREARQGILRIMSRFRDFYSAEKEEEANTVAGEFETGGITVGGMCLAKFEQWKSWRDWSDVEREIEEERDFIHNYDNLIYGLYLNSMPFLKEEYKRRLALLVGTDAVTNVLEFAERKGMSKNKFFSRIEECAGRVNVHDEMQFNAFIMRLERLQRGEEPGF